MSRRTGIITAALATAFALGTLSGPATATSAAHIAGNCSSYGNSGSVKAYYYTSGNYDYFNRINYFLGGKGLRNKSNVHLRIRKHRPGFYDKTLWEWRSGDNVRPGGGGRSVNVRVKRGDTVYVDYRFVFDRRLGDPRCHGKTNRI
ncbi:hypothetical protein ACIBEJ_33305 [Nonomuraea sp. NPDC050790]|uniref:hypothetical protein n=1 Tax=Nonomuraea sp. NPDC050790 TaxID=3364371 RepID=UPI0037B7BF87